MAGLFYDPKVHDVYSPIMQGLYQGLQMGMMVRGMNKDAKLERQKTELGKTLKTNQAAGMYSPTMGTSGGGVEVKPAERSKWLDASEYWLNKGDTERAKEALETHKMEKYLSTQPGKDAVTAIIATKNAWGKDPIPDDMKGVLGRAYPEIKGMNLDTVKTDGKWVGTPLGDPETATEWAWRDPMTGEIHITKKPTPPYKEGELRTYDKDGKSITEEYSKGKWIEKATSDKWKLDGDKKADNWSDPYKDKDSGALLQKNTKTGEVRAVVGRAPSEKGDTAKPMTPSEKETALQHHIANYGATTDKMGRMMTYTPQGKVNRLAGWLRTREIEDKRGRLTSEELNQTEQAIMTSLGFDQKIQNNINLLRDQGATAEEIKMLLREFIGAK